jgi:hypothetical protein
MARYGTRSSVITAFGAFVALLAIVGTRFLGWEWGDGRLVPTLVGVAVAGIAVLLTLERMA